MGRRHLDHQEGVVGTRNQRNILLILVWAGRKKAEGPVWVLLHAKSSQRTDVSVIKSSLWHWRMPIKDLCLVSFQ
jgi:hypothetical protein